MEQGDWSSGPWSSAATADQGPWGRYLPRAWQMVADSRGNHRPPDPPPTRGATHGDLIAWWAPLTHLTMFGLGWAYPFRGLARWDQAGRPSENAILEVVERWWGQRLEDALAWGVNFAPGEAGGPDMTFGRQRLHSRGGLFQKYSTRAADEDWRAVWGHPGHNVLHWAEHTKSPWVVESTESVTNLRGDGRTHALVLDHYSGWYRHLLSSSSVAGGLTGPSSPRVDVIVRPIGWLGTYRLSSATGLWFTGQHRIHQLGSELA